MGEYVNKYNADSKENPSEHSASAIDISLRIWCFIKRNILLSKFKYIEKLFNPGI